MFRISPDRLSQFSIVGFFMVIAAFGICIYALATHPFPPKLEALVQMPLMLTGAVLAVVGLCIVHWCSGSNDNP